jgi:hypothetical protein
MASEATGQHIGNIKASKGGKGINLHIFKGNLFGTIPLSRLEIMVDEIRISGTSKQIIPIVHLEMNKQKEVIKNV